MGCGEYCLDVEYRSMGESPDISGAWNVAVRERERESQVGAGTVPRLVQHYSTTVHSDRKLQEMSCGQEGSTYRLFRQELCVHDIIIIFILLQSFIPATLTLISLAGVSSEV